jgi:nitroreductase
MKKQITELVQNRYSPMIFEDRKVSEETMNQLITAATLAASSYNAQPWRFIWAEKGSEDYAKLRSLLSEYNQTWTATAPILMLTLSLHIDDKGRQNYFSLYDLGQAVSSMAIQAVSIGLQLHQMGGFDMDMARKITKMPDTYLPGAMIAIGYPGDKSQLTGHFLERANEPRVRLSVDKVSGDTGMFNTN